MDIKHITEEIHRSIELNHRLLNVLDVIHVLDLTKVGQAKSLSEQMWESSRTIAALIDGESGQSMQRLDKGNENIKDKVRTPLQEMVKVSRDLINRFSNGCLSDQARKASVDVAIAYNKGLAEVCSPFNVNFQKEGARLIGKINSQGEASK